MDPTEDRASENAASDSPTHPLKALAPIFLTAERSRTDSPEQLAKA